MTEENYNYRTSQTLLRNQFPGKGKLQIPIIPKFQEKAGDFDDFLLIGFDKTHLEDQNHLDRMVHFFLYDYCFERVEWQGQEYGIWSENGSIRITCSGTPNESHIFENSDAALQFMVGPDRLRDVITQVTVLDRTL